MKRDFIILLAALLVSLKAHASFGPTKVVDSYTVNRIYQGAGPTFVTFTGAEIAECSNNGGYLQPSWILANDGVIDDGATSRMLSVLLSAKAMGAKVEVRYKVYSEGTGWNKCAISAVYMH